MREGGRGGGGGRRKRRCARVLRAWARRWGITWMMGSEEARGGMADHGWSTAGRVVAVVMLLAAVSVACMFLPVDKILESFIIWVQTDVGPWGPLIYVLAYIPCTVLAIPASLLTLGGGYLYGLYIGFITDSIGSTLGSTAAFLVGRTVGRSYVTSKLKDYPHFRAIATAIEKSGFKIVLLLRMVPLLPFNMLNYLLAVTPISVSTYTLASCIGMMPMTLVFVYAGTTIKNIQDFNRDGGQFSPTRWILLGAGLFTSVVIVLLVTRVAKNALQQAVDSEEIDVEENVVSPSVIKGEHDDLHQPLVVRTDVQ